VPGGIRPSSAWAGFQDINPENGSPASQAGLKHLPVGTLSIKLKVIIANDSREAVQRATDSNRNG